MSKWKNLIEIADITTGFPFKGEKYSATGIRTVRGENVTEGRLRWDTIKCWNEPFDKEENYLLEKDDIVIGMDGSKVGKNKARIRKNDLPLLLAQRVACVRAKKGNDQIYLYYLINNPRFENYVFKTQTGSSVPHISRKQIEDFKVPVFDLPTQQKIASVLSALDDKIELNNSINSELEQMAKTLYDYWFVQFDFPNEDGKPYKSSGGKMIYNKTLKREIPQGWEVKRLEEIENNIITGKTPSTLVKDNFGSDIPFVTIDDIRKQLFIINSDRKLSEKGAGTQQSKFLEIGDICVSCIGTVGVIGIVGKKCQTNQQINTISKVKDYNRYFLLNALKKYFEFNVAAKQGAVLSNMNKGEFSDIPILDCPKEIKTKFLKIVMPFYNKLNLNLQQNQELASLRDWLLPMLMNGQVKVED